MEVEIKKKIDTNRTVTDLSTVGEMIGNSDYELGNSDCELIENTCEEAALIITELCYQLRNTKEALKKYMNGERLEEIQKNE